MNSTTIKQSVTFESLTAKQDAVDVIDTSSIQDELVNQEYWKNQIFIKKIKDLKNISEDNLKHEFLLWHNSLGQSFFNKQTRELDSSSKGLTSIKIAEFLNNHPSLTKSDSRKLILIKQEMKDKYKRIMSLYYPLVLSSMLFYLRRKSQKTKKEMNSLIRPLAPRILVTVVISFLVVDITFRVCKPRLMINMINEKGMKKRYFDDYL